MDWPIILKKMINIQKKFSTLISTSAFLRFRKIFISDMGKINTLDKPLKDWAGPPSELNN